MSSEQRNSTALKDAQLKDLLLERGTPVFGFVLFLILI